MGFKFLSCLLLKIRFGSKDQKKSLNGDLIVSSIGKGNEVRFNIHKY